MIYENSRYINTRIQSKDGHSYFKLRNMMSFNLNNAKVHCFSLGERLDGLAQKYYKNPHLWWVILEANPQYKSELEIPYGANLIIPSESEVSRCLIY